MTKDTCGKCHDKKGEDCDKFDEEGNLRAVLNKNIGKPNCTKTCADGLGCVSCGFNKQGDFPKSNIVYQGCLNNATCMINAWQGTFQGKPWSPGQTITDVVSGAFNDVADTDGMTPMLSFESAHDIGFTADFINRYTVKPLKDSDQSLSAF